MNAYVDLTGFQIGIMRVVRKVGGAGDHEEWELKCSCGNPKTRIAKKRYIVKRSVRSYGCLNEKAGQKKGFRSIRSRINAN